MNTSARSASPRTRYLGLLTGCVLVCLLACDKSPEDDCVAQATIPHADAQQLAFRSVHIEFISSPKTDIRWLLDVTGSGSFQLTGWSPERGDVDCSGELNRDALNAMRALISRIAARNPSGTYVVPAHHVPKRVVRIDLNQNNIEFTHYIWSGGLSAFKPTAGIDVADREIQALLDECVRGVVDIVLEGCR